MRETTLVLLKPDAVERGLVGRLLARFEDKGLRPRGLKLMRCSRELLEEHYSDHAEKPFFESLLAFMSSGPVLALALEGEAAIEVVRGLMGPTDGKKAPPGTIRGDFGMSRSFNLVHGSDSAASAAKELGLFFSDGELLDHVPDRMRWVYDRDE